MEDLKIINTNNFSTINKVCNDAQNKSKMISIIGYPGAGKTTGLLHYYKTTPNVYYVRVQPSMQPRTFYSAILNSMGEPVTEQGMQLHFMIKKICYFLNENNEKKLLIIDEAGKFSRKMLEYIHELRDETAASTGIILAGPEYFQKNLIKWVNKELDGMPEIYRRINYWQNLTKPTKEEIRALCIAYGVKEETTQKSLMKLCSNFGEVHNRIMDLNYLEKETV
jgi:DNA transposition AAA+ family ATPase